MRPSIFSDGTLTLPLTTIATLLTVVACGPTKDYVPIGVAPGTPLGQAVVACTNEIRPSTAKVVTSTVAICEVGADGLYAKTDHTFRYDVQSVSGRLRLSVKPGLDLGTEATPQARAAVKSVIDNVCVKRINSVFQRSFKRGGMDAIVFNLAIDEKPVADSPMIDLADVSGTPETQYVMKGWPDRARVFPYGLKKDNDTCEKVSKTADEKQRCRWAAVEAANEPFCAQLAVISGHWLGLKAPKSETRCKDKSVTPDDATSGAEVASTAGKPQPKPEADSVYMKGGYEMDPKEFFAKATLSNADLKAVFAPACTSFRNLPANAAFKR